MPNLHDIDLMQLADGELDPAREAEVEAAIASEPGGEASAKLASLRGVSEVVRGQLELATDDAEPRFAALWAQIEKRIDVAAPAGAPVAPGVKVPVRRGAWARLAGWLDGHRSHVLTGLISAGAVAAITLTLAPAHERVVERLVATRPPPIDVTPTLMHTAPQVESLEVPGGTGTVFTIEDDDGGTAVIWVTPNDTVEGI